MSDERDRGLLGLVERLMKRPEPAKPVVPPHEGRQEGLDPVVPEQEAPASLEPQLAIESTRRVQRVELADIIQRRLLSTEGCPQRGFEITVYGARPWNAMLRITPVAGRVNAKLWRGRLQDMVLLLREQYEIAEETDV